MLSFSTVLLEVLENSIKKLIKDRRARIFSRYIFHLPWVGSMDQPVHSCDQCVIGRKSVLIDKLVQVCKRVLGFIQILGDRAVREIKHIGQDHRFNLALDRKVDYLLFLCLRRHSQVPPAEQAWVLSSEDHPYQGCGG